MLHYYFLKTNLKNEEIISAIKDYKAISIRPELGALKAFVERCHALALQDFLRRENAAKDFAIQWLCRIACSKNIQKALHFCTFKGNVVGIVSEREIPAKVLTFIGQKIAFKSDAASRKKLASEYSIPISSLEKFGLEDLLEEKSVISMLE